MNTQNKSPRRIRAIFKGHDGSLGYRNGFTHNLLIETRPSEIFPDKRPILYIERVWDNAGGCEYEHFEKFLDNWDKIENDETKY